MEQAEFFDLPVYNLIFDYNTPTGELQGVLWNLDAGDKEAMDAWFENNWDVTVWLTRADEDTWVVSFARVVSPF